MTSALRKTIARDVNSAREVVARMLKQFELEGYVELGRGWIKIIDKEKEGDFIMKVITLNSENFEKEVLNSKVPVVVDFWAPWCGPCRMMGPVMEKIAEESDGSYIVGKINVDEEDELSDRYNVMSIPAIKVFKGGEVSAATVGVTSQDKIMEMISAN